LRTKFYSIFFLFLGLKLSAQILLATPETAFDVQHNFNAELLKMKNVRKITFEIVDKKDYEIPIDKNLVETYEFDTNGLLSRFYFTNIVKTIEKQTTVTTRKGKKGYQTYTESKNEYLYDTTSTSYYYNNGKLVLKRYFDGAMFYESRYYRYDSLGNVVKELRYRETNNSRDKNYFILGTQLLLSEDSFQYKKYPNGQLHCFSLNNENRPYKQQISYYDVLGLKIKTSEHYTAASWITQEHTYEYKAGRLIEARFKGNADKEVNLKVTFEYDMYNQLLTEKRYKDDVLQKELSYITNSADKLLSSLVIRDHVNRSIRIVKLKYDFGSLSSKEK